MNIGNYLLTRLEQIGIKHVFGVPGDYALNFIKQIEMSNLQYIGTCNELNAGYAADAYSRCIGVSAVVVVYGVGALSCVNAVAGAYAEQIPMVVISGAPPTSLWQQNNPPLIHHSMGKLTIPYKIFQNITVASTILLDAAQAPAQIDQLLRDCLHNKGPVFLELPKDIIDKPCQSPDKFILSPPTVSDPHALAELITETCNLLQNSKNPIFLVGNEIATDRLQQSTLSLIEKSSHRFATVSMSKGILPENHPQFIGTYEGQLGPEQVREQVENSDCIICLGMWMTDMNTGVSTAHLDINKMIQIQNGKAQIKYHFFNSIYLHDFITTLTQRVQPIQQSNTLYQDANAFEHSKEKIFTPIIDKKITTARFFDRIASFLKKDDVILTDVGNASFSLLTTQLPNGSHLIAQNYYESIGYSVGALLGACLANPSKRHILFVGDGALQMSAQEISTILKYQLTPIIFVLNNHGYTIERAILDGEFNDIQNWHYHQIPQLMNQGCGYDIQTEGELERTLEQINQAKSLSLIEVHLDKNDYCESLKKLETLLHARQQEITLFAKSETSTPI